MRRSFIVATVVAALLPLAGCTGGQIGPIDLPSVSAPDTSGLEKKVEEEAKKFQDHVRKSERSFVVESKRFDGSDYYLAGKDGWDYRMPFDADWDGSGEGRTKEFYDSVKKGATVSVRGFENPLHDNTFVVATYKLG